MRHYFNILLLIALLLSCTPRRGQNAVSSSASPFEIASFYGEKFKTCISNGGRYISDSKEEHFWKQFFILHFKEFYYSKKEFHFLKPELYCELDDGGHLVTFIYQTDERSSFDKDLRTTNSVLTIISPNMQIRGYVDIACDFIDDVAGIRKLNSISDSTLYAECGTSGWFGPGTFAVIKEQLAIDLQNFTYKVIDRTVEYR